MVSTCTPGLTEKQLLSLAASLFYVCKAIYIPIFKYTHANSLVTYLLCLFGTYLFTLSVCLSVDRDVYTEMCAKI